MTVKNDTVFIASISTMLVGLIVILYINLADKWLILGIAEIATYLLITWMGGIIISICFWLTELK